MITSTSAAGVSASLAEDPSDPSLLVQFDLSDELDGVASSLGWKILELDSRGRPDGQYVVLAIRKALDQSHIVVEAYEIFDSGLQPALIARMEGKKDAKYVAVTDGYLLIKDKRMRRKGIGTACFNEVISWALTHHENERLKPIKVFEHHAAEFSPEARHRWYRQFGFFFAYEDGRSHPKAQGVSTNEYVRELNLRKTKVRQLPLLQFLSECESAVKCAQRDRDEAEDYVARHRSKVRLLTYGNVALIVALAVCLTLLHL